MYQDPVIILAPPRSFTSLVCAVLGQHPELYGLPELNLFQAETMDEFWTGLGQEGRLKSPFWNVMRHGMLRTVAQLYAGEQTVASVEMAERWIRTRRHVTTGDVYKELCRRAAPLRLVEKSPAYLRKRLYLDRMLETFPNARLIHLVRDPRGQCESVLKVKGGQLLLLLLGSVDHSGPAPVLDPQILWHDSHIQIMNFLEPLPRDQWLRVRGEDFLTDMDRVLRDICAWLGISTSDDAIEAMKHPEDSPFSCMGPVNARLGNDPNFLESPELKPSKAKAYDLDEALPWRADGLPFYPRIRSLAEELGYRSAPARPGHGIRSGAAAGRRQPARQVVSIRRTALARDQEEIVPRASGPDSTAATAATSEIEAGAPAPAPAAAAAPAARAFVAPELGATIGTDGEVAGAGIRQILKDPQLRQMAMSLWRQMQHGTAANAKALQESGLTPADIWAPGLTESLSPADTPEEIERYRLKLQFRADVLEAMLDATLTELEQLAPHQAASAPSVAAIAGQESRAS